MLTCCRKSAVPPPSLRTTNNSVDGETDRRVVKVAKASVQPRAKAHSSFPYQNCSHTKIKNNLWSANKPFLSERVEDWNDRKGSKQRWNYVSRGGDVHQSICSEAILYLFGHYWTTKAAPPAAAPVPWPLHTITTHDTLPECVWLFFLLLLLLTLLPVATNELRAYIYTCMKEKKNMDTPQVWLDWTKGDEKRRDYSSCLALTICNMWFSNFVKK